MKFQINRITLILSIVVLTFTFTANISATQKTKLVSEKEKISYSIGLSIGNNFKQQKIDIEMDSLAQGIEDALTGAKQKMTQEEIRQTMEAFRRQMQARAESNRQAASSGNQVEGEKFLAQNKKRKNVVTLASGLQYEIVNKGSGKRPGLTDTVVTHYKGTLISGKEFDSSYKRGQPAEFPVNGVIKGWTEALQLMQQGAKWKLYIPADLAYGSRGAGNSIGPNEALIFEIELLEVK